MEVKLKTVRYLSAIMIFFGLLAISGAVFADDEIYPGFDECNATTETMGQENVCWGKAIKYWSAKLDEQYSKIRKGCATAPNPEQCKAKLKKMQQGWLNYSNGMADILKNGLLHEQEFATTTSINEALTFEAYATRGQYEMLKKLE